jgi:hypothetical protein
MQKVRQCKNNTAQNNTGDECSSFSKGDQASHFTISLFKYLKRHAKADSPLAYFHATGRRAFIQQNQEKSG